MKLGRVRHAVDAGFPDPRDGPADAPLAMGGDLSAERLLAAYDHGIFPWFEDDRGPVLWWSPDPRAVLPPDRVKVSRSLARRLRRRDYAVTMDTAFAAVVAGCAAPREPGGGTWITPGMRDAYARLHALGFAHSVEAWDADGLAGGLYGVSLGTMFFGESMFSRRPDASKVALVVLARQLVRWGFELIDCQLPNAHLASLGAKPLARDAFLDRLTRNRHRPTRRGTWSTEAPPDAVEHGD